MLEEDPVAEAVTVLMSRGHIVEPDDDFENWRVNGADLLALAICLGLNAGTGRLQ